MSGILFLILLIASYFVGRALEVRHLRHLNHEESKLQYMAVRVDKHHLSRRTSDAHLVSGSVVISTDIFKAFYASLINLLGGRMVPLESLLIRARREAVIRMKRNAQTINTAEIVGLRFETSKISMSTATIGTVEVIAYGTALVKDE